MDIPRLGENIIEYIPAWQGERERSEQDPAYKPITFWFRRLDRKAFLEVNQFRIKTIA